MCENDNKDENYDFLIIRFIMDELCSLRNFYQNLITEYLNDKSKNKDDEQ